MAEAGSYQASDPGAEPRQDAGLGELLGRLGEQSSRLVRQEIALAKAEIREEVDKARRAAVLFAGVAAAALVAVLLLAFAAAWGLAEVMAPGLAFLVVAVVLGVVAGVLYQRARSLTAEIEPVPERTVDTLKEDAQWVKERRA